MMRCQECGGRLWLPDERQPDDLRDSEEMLECEDCQRVEIHPKAARGEEASRG